MPLPRTIVFDVRPANAGLPLVLLVSGSESPTVRDIGLNTLGDLEVGTLAEWVGSLLTVFILFAAVVAVVLQRRELEKQREELELQRKELANQPEQMAASAAAQGELALTETQKLAADLQRSVDLTRALLVDIPSDLADTATRKVQFPSGTTITAHVGRAVITKEESEPFASVAVPFRNVGAGIAFIESVFVSSGPGQSYEGEAPTKVVPSGEFARAVFSIPRSDAHLQALIDNRSLLTAHIKYTNAAGADPLQTDLQIEADSGHGSGLIITGVCIADSVDYKTVVQSGPADG